MYLVTLHEDYADDKGITIHSPYTNDLKLSDATVNIVLGTIHDFSFTINLNNPAWSKISPLKTIVKVKDTLTQKVIFEGRTLQPKTKMDSEGMFSKLAECESILAYLLDSSQRHAEIHDTTIADFLQIILDNHNAQVEPHKRFKLGDVTVSNPTDNVYRYLGYEDTFATIKDKLVDRLGGYITCRRESDGLYLDYLEEVGSYVENAPIRLAHNMQSVDYEVDPTEVITRLVPLGKSIESEDEGAADASQARLTIESVNNGKDYIDDEDLIAEFGIVEKSFTWDDVTQPNRLLTNGQNYLRDQKAAIARFDVNSTNTHLLDREIESFEVGNYHELINPVISLKEYVQIIEKKIDINEPQRSSLKIGDKFRTLTEYQKGIKQTKKEVTELKGAVERQTQRIAHIQTEVDNVNDSLSDLVQAFNDADIPAIEQAVSDLSDAVDNLTDAIDSIPDYSVATSEKDGLMAKEDKVKLDLINLVNSIDLEAIRYKLNLITVSNSIDLDDLVERVEVLEND